jgi:hypothetical protein
MPACPRNPTLAVLTLDDPMPAGQTQAPSTPGRPTLGQLTRVKRSMQATPTLARKTQDPDAYPW